MERPPLPPPGWRDPVWVAWILALFLLAPVWVPYAAWRLLRGNSREGRGERFGGGRTLPAPGGLRAWFHGVSVGEVEALAPVIGAFREADPSAEVVVTSTTPTGRARAEALYPGVLDRRFAPLDLPPVTARTLDRIRPGVLVLGESELWPSLLRMTARRAPVVVVNARISDRTLPRARRLRVIYRWMLRHLTAVGVQTPEDRTRFISLGLDPGRVRVTGNTKFDRVIAPLSPEEAGSLREALGVGPAPLLVAGSTFPGEDELVLDALLALRAEAPARPLRLVLAPRHPHRGDEVEAAVRARGLTPWRRSAGPAPQGVAVDVAILDTVGELARVYALARVAVVGRSFRTGGGQNPLEPMALGVPVVYGPQMENFRQIAQLAEAGGAAHRCHGDGELLPALRTILEEPERHRRMASAGPRILGEHQGAGVRSAALILEAARAPFP